MRILNEEIKAINIPIEVVNKKMWNIYCLISSFNA